MRKCRWLQAAAVIVFACFLYWESVQNDMIARRFEEEIDACLKDGCLPIAVLSQETGAYAYVGQPALWAAQYAVDQVNREGGVNGCKVRLVTADTGSEKSRALSLYQGAGRKCCIVLGPTDAPETAWISQNADADDHTVHIAAYSYRESREKRAPYGISYMSDSEDGELEAVRVFAKENPDIRDVVLFSMSSDEAKNSSAWQFQELQGELGLHFLDVIDVSPDAQESDYRQYAIRALNQKADGYVFLLGSRDYAEILKELRSHGIEEGRRITASFSAFNQETMEIAQEALDGTYIWNKIDPYYEGENWQKLREAYGAAGYEESQISQPVADYYDAVMAICQCYEVFGMTSENYVDFRGEEQIAEWFYDSGEMEGIQGAYCWQEGQKMSEYQFFVFDGTVPVNLRYQN